MRTFELSRIRKYVQDVNWQLLVFLILVMNVKFVIKIVAIILVCILNRKNLFSRQVFQQKFLWFYLAMILLAATNALVHASSLSQAYLLAIALGMVYWLFAGIAGYNSFLFVQKISLRKLHYTMTIFFTLHILFVLLNLLGIMIETGSINPYTYRGMNQHYYISTGDFIKGISFDNPVTTAFISAFGLLYFLYRRQMFLSIFSMACLLIQCSNLTNFMLMGTFIYMFFFRSDRIQKSMIVVYVIMTVIFLGRISPQNSEYIGRPIYKLIGKPYDVPVKVDSIKSLREIPDSLLGFEERRTKFSQLYLDSIGRLKYTVSDPVVPGKNNSPSTELTVKTIAANTKKAESKIDSQFYKYKEPTDFLERKNKYVSFVNEVYTRSGADSLQTKYDWNQPGKLIAFQQLFDFYKQHPKSLLLGTGMGNFSSRLSFKVTALGISGTYPRSFRYLHPFFRDNHLFTYLYYHSLEQSKHAAANVPDSVYGQLLGEYGILGLLAFFVFYVGWFLRYVRYLSYGIPLLILLAGAFLVEYWFEQLSIVILFELLFLLDIKSNTPGNAAGLRVGLSTEEEA